MKGYLLYTNSDFKAQTLDVWFDSGMTHTTVVNEQFGTTQSDLYLEGTDQHRGWFQSSLLTSMALNESSPYKEVFTHGFVVDDKGRKFSKSLGNYVAMDDLLKEYSPDVLRVWALSQDYHKELTYSKETMMTSLERYKKFRNTFRFMLQNLDGFKPSEMKMEQLDLLDKFVLFKTHELKDNVLLLADKYRFNEALSQLHSFCDLLSVVYLDSQKDRLYCYAKTDDRRVLTQNVLHYVQHTLMMLLTPYLPYSMEEYYNKSHLYNLESVLMEEFYPSVSVEVNSDRFNELLDLKLTCNKLFEEQRSKKLLSKNNERDLYCDMDLNDDENKALSLMLGVYVFKGNNLELRHHNLNKCDRCWNYFDFVYANNLCKNCDSVENKNHL